MYKSAVAVLAVLGLLIGCQAGTERAAVGGGAGALWSGPISDHEAQGAGGADQGDSAAIGPAGLMYHAVGKLDNGEAVGGVAALGVAVGPASAPVTKAEVIGWSRRGVRDEIIIDRIERSGTVFTLKAADENQLRKAGVSEDVIRAMKDAARRR